MASARYGEAINEPGAAAPRSVDAIIIGAGVIGAAIAFELAKRGYKTLNIDKLPAAGYGPTSNSCSIVRAHYSSREGVAMAYEGFFYWQDWEHYLGVIDDAGTARYVQSGTILLKSATGHHEKVLHHYRDLGVEFEEWDSERLRQRIPIYDTGSFWPPKRPEDPSSGMSRAPSCRAQSSRRGRATSMIPSSRHTTSSGRRRTGRSSCSKRRLSRSVAREIGSVG